MDLNSLKLSTSTVVEIVHPETLAPLGITITLASPDSEVIKGMMRERLNRQLAAMAAGRKQKPVQITAEELEADRLSVLVAATLSWSGVEIGADEVPCTPQAVRNLYSDPAFAWIRKQVDEAFGDQASFFQK